MLIFSDADDGLWLTSALHIVVLGADCVDDFERHNADTQVEM
jgi:hypothetical protein